MCEELQDVSHADVATGRAVLVYGLTDCCVGQDLNVRYHLPIGFTSVLDFEVGILWTVICDNKSKNPPRPIFWIAIDFVKIYHCSFKLIFNSY